MMGELLTRWTIRAALACYFAVVAARLWYAPQRGLPTQWQGTARWLWTIGCLLFFSHMAAAFAFYHHWSHAAAFAETARQTKELLGVPVGIGLYFNYVFAAVWLADVAWWWFGAKYAARPRWLAWLMDGYLFFIAFNGAVVFASGAMQWGGIAASLVLAILVVRSWWVSAAARNQEPSA